MKKGFFAVLLASIMLVLSGCGNNVEQTVSQIKDVVSTENEHVKRVKEGYLDDEPNITVGELFDNFFANPKWTYFKADTGEDVVEFTGDMMYMETEVNAKLQIIVGEDTFEFGALAFNNVPQTELVTSAVLSAILEESNGGTDVNNSGLNLSSNTDNTLMDDLYFGYIPALQFGINDTIDRVIELYGEPLEANLYGGSYYLRYDGFTVFNDNIEYEYSGLVSAVSFHDGSLFDMEFSGGIEEAINKFGLPDETYNDVDDLGYLLIYNIGDYVLEVGADDKFSPINYIDFYKF